MEEILLSVSSPLEVDLEIFQLWIEGCTTEQVTSMRLNDMRKQTTVSSPGYSPSQSFMGMNFRYNYYLQNSYDFKELVQSEVLDQYRNFAALEHFLSQPLLLFKQNLYLFLTTNLIYHIIESYYALSSQFVRELLNKRLVKLNRKDLEDVSDSLQMNLKTITRQLNNIQQIYNTYDDVNFTGNLYHFIVKNYCLSRSLAQRYACIIFLLYAKFNITSKRRLQRIPCEK
ncbi:hypothetical protein EON64_02355 [archaeon]|nr:MAG: hypothetical protein EON64_02355 [archaeon]